MEDSEDRVAGERRGGLDVVQERGRVGRQLEQVVEALGAGAHAEPVAELGEPPGGEAVAAREHEVVALREPVVRVALEVPAGALAHARVGGRVDVVDVTADGRQAAGDERLAQRLRARG